MQNNVGSENSFVFARNAFALQKTNGILNSSFDRGWFLALLPSYFGCRCGWLHVVKICTIKKKNLSVATRRINFGVSFSVQPA